MASPDQFAARLLALARNVELNAGSALRDAVGTAVVTLVRLTPVGGPPTSPQDRHPGLARSNWQVGHAPADVMRPEQSEAGAIAEGIASALRFREDQEVVISNPVPYINRLNAGSSTQAPAGFVEAALAAASNEARGIRLLVTPRRRS